ncbi:uncharacterized protein Z518_02764 [Rhinocladiella mackenziei CBS 650.93]|uniref:Uncharacterized protein n=1 Tax=Rhinocladiella mackenziei CBS 650.93 TaxID=1442369 RepID=A0A0D2HCE4_9EURO|nr:uncharacterized protein Z518_02764 [Rhinocladiella mackenziei CBS 650.93]KIX08108.1 hypothetical protein Z518_02764 [Rhinocladiella mackenziei CBS 650.93]
MTPDYEVLCNGRVMDEGWFASLQKPNVGITTLPITSIQPRSVTLGPGRHYPPMSKSSSTAPTEARIIPADVIIMAGGYDTNQWRHPLDITGRNGRSPYKNMGGAGWEPQHILELVILARESMVNYNLSFTGPILRGDVDMYEVKESMELKRTSDLQKVLKNSLFPSSGCKSWDVGADGWNSTVYPTHLG